MNRKLLLIGVVVAMVALAGCAGAIEDNESQGEDLAEDTGIDTEDVNVGESMVFEMTYTESNHYELVRGQPPVQMDESLERANLIQRYEYLNDRSNTHHVYMLSHDGKVMNYEVAQGKVSSVNSKLTNDKQIVEAPGSGFRGGSGAGADGANFKVVESPQADGSYGENGDAIFFFTTSGEYVEYNGIYVVSEEPKQITTEVTLVDEIEDDEDE